MKSHLDVIALAIICIIFVVIVGQLSSCASRTDCYRQCATGRTAEPDCIRACNEGDRSPFDKLTSP